MKVRNIGQQAETSGVRDSAVTLAKTDKSGLSRRALLGAFAATTLTAAPTFSNAAGFLRGAGDIRRIRMFSGRTGERIDMVYWIDGKYIK
ncbi:MAG: Tat pathway signal protein, partial [Pseudomonadota bacterium]|nr:Tat pathway signal protein [Pseudomonadota bacterium]